MPKILRILNRLNIGGPTFNVTNLSAYLPANYETKVLAGFKEESEGSSEYMLKDKGINYAFVPGMFRSIHPKNDWKAYQFIKKEIKDFRPDIVHTHAAKAGALGRLAAHFSKDPPKVLIHTYHGNVFDGYFSPLKTRVFLAIERYLCKISTVVIAISKQQKDDLVYKYKIVSAEKVRVIRLGFDLDSFLENRAEKRKIFRDFYRIEEQEVVITITGRLAPVKDHHLFIDALSYLKKHHPDLPFKVFIVGDGELFEAIVEQVKQAGFSYCLPKDKNFEAQVIFTSWRKDIDVINAGCDIIALSSLNEGTPVSIIEAQAAGKAVICTQVGGVSDVVQHLETGILVKSNANEFAEGLNMLISDQQLRERLGINAEEFSLANYSVKRLISETEDLYEQLLRK